MLLNKELYGSIAHEAARSPQLRMHHDLHDSENEDNVCLMSFCPEQRLLYFTIQTLQKLL